MLSYRSATPDDIPAAARLVAHSFPGPTRPPTWWEAQLMEPLYGGGPEILIVGSTGGRMVAAAQIHPLRQWVGGQLLEVAGVGSVAISPAHRQRRLGAELVTASLRAARERGDVASALYPFRVSFYAKLGYGQSGVAHQHQVAPQSLPDSDERMRVELMEDDIRRVEVVELYERWARTQNSQLQRPERLWVSLCGGTDRALAAYRADDGMIEGYALVVYRADLPPKERYLEVDELVWTSRRAQAGLVGWLSSLGDQWQSLLIRTLPSQRAEEWIREPRLPWGAAPSWRLWAPAATLLHGTMFRLLDMRAWEGRRIEAAPTLTVMLHVQDAQIQENNGDWQLTLDQGRVSIERSRGATCDVTLRTDAASASRLFTNALPPTAAHHAGLLECDRPELLPVLDAALRLPEPWTFDRF